MQITLHQGVLNYARLLRRDRRHAHPEEGGFGSKAQAFAAAPGLGQNFLWSSQSFCI